MNQDFSTLRVALIHYWLTGMRGGEKVLEALCRLFPQADIYTHVVKRENLSATLRAHTIRTTFIQRLPFASSHFRHYLPLMPMALEQLDLRGYDLVISSESGPSKGVIVRADAPHICYCHTPMRYLWDFYPDYLESAGPLQKLFMRLMFPRLRLWDFASAQRVDHVIANSSTVARRVKRWWGKDAEVIHPPVSIERFLKADTAALDRLPAKPAPGSYYLCLGELVDYKHVDLAVNVCSATGRRLLVAGDGPARKALEATAGPSVTFLGRVDGDVVPALYAGCKAFLFPGEEDFGIAPVEALAAGACVIAYGRGGVRDSLVDGENAMFFPEQSEASLLGALNRFETSPPTASFRQIANRLENFSEEAFLARISTTVKRELERFGRTEQTEKKA